MTRFYSLCSAQEIYQRLRSTFEQFLVPFRDQQLNSKVTFNFISFKIGFSTVDKRKCPMHGEVSIQNVGDMSLVTFRKSRVRLLILYNREILLNLKDFIMQSEMLCMI